MEDSEYIDLSLYNDTPETKNYNVIESPLELFLQEIEIAVKTENYGSWSFIDTINFKKYLFRTNVPTIQISREVERYIEKHCEGAGIYDWDVNTELVRYKGRLALIITVNVYQETDDGVTEPFWTKFMIDAERT